MFSIVQRNPFNDDSHWYYTLQGPIEVKDARRLSITTLPPPPSLTFCLNFTTQTIFCTRPDSILASEPPVPAETKVFTMDIKSFTNRFSADQAINSMFMNTMTGRAFSPERRLWMVTRLSEPIRRYVHSSISTLDANITFQLDVVDELEGSFLHEDIEEEHIMQEFSEEWLEDEDESFEDHEEEFSEEWLEDEEESFEDHEEEEFSEDVECLSICPAPPALVESLKTEVYESEEGDQAEDCMICFKELVARVEIKRLPCSHCFHVDCIDGWFQRKDTCPLCQKQVASSNLKTEQQES